MPATVIPFPRPEPPNEMGVSALSELTPSSTSSQPAEGAWFPADSLPAERSRSRGVSALFQHLVARRRSGRKPQPGPSWQRCPPRWQLRDERGAVTAEYAIVILAAVAFAGLLVAIMRSDEVRAMLVALVQNALGAAG